MVKNEEEIGCAARRFPVALAHIALQGARCARVQRHEAGLAELRLPDLQYAVLEIDVLAPQCGGFRNPH